MAQNPPQHQQPPGLESEMTPSPQTEKETPGCNKLQDKIAIITGGDSGIGRAVAVAFAKEGADVAIVYLSEDSDAEKTKRLVEEKERKCLLLKGDIGISAFCSEVVKEVIDTYGRIDILVNNAGEQHPQNSLLDITDEQLLQTFRTNIFSFFYMARAVLPHLQKGSTIINTASVTTYKGSPKLLDYSSTKGAIIGLTRSLSLSLIQQGIRVNAVAPGPIWTPLIVSTFPEQKVESFGEQVPMGREGQPAEVATCYVFLASDDSSYMSGQTLHPNGGTIVNG